VLRAVDPRPRDAPGPDAPASLARRAVAAGVLLSVDSDAHRTEMLERHMSVALLIARRGWVERDDVLNTRSLKELRQFVATKRNG